jgi:hypothetical protein
METKEKTAWKRLKTALTRRILKEFETHSAMINGKNLTYTLGKYEERRKKPTFFADKYFYEFTVVVQHEYYEHALDRYRPKLWDRSNYSGDFPIIRCYLDKVAFEKKYGEMPEYAEWVVFMRSLFKEIESQSLCESLKDSDLEE